jgi:K+-transporting ATPase ATPase A chain
MYADILQIVLFCVLILILTPILGSYMHRVFTGERTFLSPVLAPVERLVYGAAGVNPSEQQHWTRYTLAMLLFNAAGFLLLYALLRLQDVLPFNPQGLPALSPHLAFNTAASFMTNTNWQSYGGESTMSYFSQMAGLTVQNFLSAGTGMAIVIAVIRGFVGRQVKSIGNFYVDLTRACLYILLPICVIAALVMIWQGMPQNLDAYTAAKTLEGADQTIAQGPVASQLAIKQLGTNGGGFFNANSAHPYENPTPLTNFLQMALMLCISAAFTYTFGRMVGDQRQGWAIFTAMAILYVAGIAITYVAEMNGNPLLASAPIDQAQGNMEGKEVRFGVVNSALWAVTTTALSCGAVNAMHDSFTPIGGMIPLLNMQLGEVIFGGVGAGLYGMLLYVLLAVFIAGLMVGRTPEYLGKKIEAKEIKLTMLALLSISFSILLAAAAGVVLPSVASSIQDPGPHGLTEVLYAYSSATGNNGSAFAGFTANVPWHNTVLGICMIVGRFAFIVPILAIAGTLAAKKTVPASAGTFPTHTLLFVVLLISVILIVAGLTFFPALALGPIAEHFAIVNGQSF